MEPNSLNVLNEIRYNQYSFDWMPTSLNGKPACITLTYLGNIQIIEILTQNQKVSVIKKIPNNNNRSVAELAARFGINLIKEKEILNRILIVLALKLENFISSQQIFISTINSEKLSSRISLEDVLLEGPKITAIQIRNSLIDEKNYKKLLKILKIAGLNKDFLVDFYYYNSPDIESFYCSKPPKNNLSLVKDWFKNHTVYGKLFKNCLCTHVDLLNFPNVFIMRFGDMFKYFRIDPNLNYACLQESVKAKSYLSDAEILVYKKVSRQLDMFSHETKIISKLNLIDSYPELKQKKLTNDQIRAMEFREYDEKLITHLRLGFPDCLDCFRVPNFFSSVSSDFYIFFSAVFPKKFSLVKS